MITNWIEEATYIDGLAERVREATSKLYDPAGPRPLLSGTPIGHPAHPMSATSAIGLFTSAVVLDWMTTRGWRWASRRLIALGLFSAGPTVITGWSDWMDTADAERRVGLVHALTNSLGLGFMAISLAERVIGRSGRFSALCGATALSAGGWLGGHLAYSLGVGVDTNAFETGPSEWTAVSVVRDGDAPLARAEVDGVGLVFVESDDAIHVLADRCSHRGGPLSEGELTDDGCIPVPVARKSVRHCDRRGMSRPGDYPSTHL